MAISATDMRVNAEERKSMEPASEKQPAQPAKDVVEQAIAAAEQALATAGEVQEAETRQESGRNKPGLRMPTKLAATGGATGLAAFAVYNKGSRAPWWLFHGVCDAWGFDEFATELRLITVSENATYLVVQHERPYGVVRVSRPGYGRPWRCISRSHGLNALHDVEGVNVVSDIPTSSGFTVRRSIDDQPAGTEWACICAEFVQGVVLRTC